jgi:hypothetical protein
MTESFILDQAGFPVMLAEVPNSGGVSYRETGSRGGNKRHDESSGKFAPGPGAKKKRTPPPGVSRADYSRMLDAVREAARAYPGGLTKENLADFLQKRASNPNAVDQQRFAQMVGQQQLDDIVDVIAGSLNKFKGPTLKAPRGYLQKVLSGRSEDDITQIIDRLEAMGLDSGIINKYIKGGAAPKKKKSDEENVEASSWDEILALDAAEAPVN